jgi:outer membrane protein OmpA-like peptidoglycan-associated protein
LVYFDWNKTSLRPLYKARIAQACIAQARIAQAAAKSLSYHSDSINVWGYTDSSGSAASNQLLSIRRAKTVADELVADGVPRSEIRIRGYGAGHQLQPTVPNVRSANNRLVEIVLQ